MSKAAMTMTTLAGLFFGALATGMWLLEMIRTSMGAG